MTTVDTHNGMRRSKEIVAKGAGVKRNRSGQITRKKILDAAETVFAEKGIHGASLREIMIAAGVNIAAVNYYFGNKTDLLRAVVHRRLGQINDARLEMLAAAKKASIDAWLDAFMVPLMRAEGSNDPGWRRFLRVLIWLATMRDATSMQVIDETYNVIRESFVEALGGALPHLSHEEVNWRYHCVLGVMRCCVAARERTAALSAGTIDPNDIDRMVRHVRTFLLAGLQAPPSPRNPALN